MIPKYGFAILEIKRGIQLAQNGEENITRIPARTHDLWSTKMKN